MVGIRAGNVFMAFAVIACRLLWPVIRKSGPWRRPSFNRSVGGGAPVAWWLQEVITPSNGTTYWSAAEPICSQVAPPPQPLSGTPTEPTWEAAPALPAASRPKPATATATAARR